MLGLFFCQITYFGLFFIFSCLFLQNNLASLILRKVGFVAKVCIQLIQEIISEKSFPWRLQEGSREKDIAEANDSW